MERTNGRYGLTVALLFVAAIYIATLFAPPHLMDDVDAVQAQIARNMIESGDWVTARLDGVAYLEKSPLKYWFMACSYAVFGVHDWAARLPQVIAILLTTLLIGRIGRWAFGERAGFWAALSFGTCVGLFLFTRILIPDLMLTGTIALTLWGFARALDEEETRPRLWIHIAWAAAGVGMLLKGLIAIVFPVAAAALFLLLSGQFFVKRTWQRLSLVTGIGLMLLVAAPWHVIATLRNPPYLSFSFDSGPGKYRGFFWFYFMNEHVLRFLNMRWPRDYNTVPRHLFWILHLVWFFPWSAFLPRLVKLDYRGTSRASRQRLMWLSLIAVVMIFFTFSTTQEYYSMPAYSGIALLLGCAIAEGSSWIRNGARVVGVVSALALTAVLALLVIAWKLPAPGDISQALAQNPEMYTLSMGHTGDLTLQSFAYLKTPLMMAAFAFAVGCVAAWKWRERASLMLMALMMVVFLNAARVAMIAFDPYLSSAPLAEALKRAPHGRVIFDDQYYTYSSVFFYADLKTAKLLNGRVNNLEYGSYAHGAPDVWLDDAHLAEYWNASERTYMLADAAHEARLAKLVGAEHLHLIASAGGKYLYSNQR